MKKGWFPAYYTGSPDRSWAKNQSCSHITFKFLKRKNAEVGGLIFPDWVFDSQHHFGLLLYFVQWLLIFPSCIGLSLVIALDS